MTGARTAEMKKDKQKRLKKNREGCGGLDRPNGSETTEVGWEYTDTCTCGGVRPMNSVK